MSKVETFQFADKDQAHSLVEDLRSNKISWILFGYASEETTALSVVDSGEGKYDAFSKYLTDDQVRYILYAVKTEEEGAYALSKYMCITWVGPGVKPILKARSSPHRVELYNFANGIVQMTGEMQALNSSEISETKIFEKVTNTYTGEKSQDFLKEAALLDAKKKGMAGVSSPAQVRRLDDDSASSGFVVPLHDEQGSAEAVKEVALPGNPTTWVAWGYEGDAKNRQSAVILGKGEGTISDFSHLLKDTDIVYVLYSATVSEGEYSVFKYILISWVGTKVKATEKARSSQHRVPIYNWANKLCPLHAELQALSPDELSEQLVQQKFAGSKYVESSGKAIKKTVSNAAPGHRSNADLSFAFADEEGATAVLKAVRDTANPTNWAVFGYKPGCQKVHVLSSGEGDLDNVEGYFEPDAIVYVVLGFVAADADYSTIKNMFISWVGPDVKPLTKAKSSQHRVSLYSFADGILSMHGEIQALNREEISKTLIAQKLTGSKLEEAGDVKQGSVASNSKGGSTESFAFEDEAAARRTLEDIRKHVGALNWVVFGYNGEDPTLKIVASGPGKYADFEKHLKEDEVCYIVYGARDEDEGDYSVYKYMCITYVGPEVKPLHKARSSPHRVELYNFSNSILQMAGEMQALNRAEISETKIMEKVTNTYSGEKSQDSLRKAAEEDARKKAQKTNSRIQNRTIYDTNQAIVPLADEDAATAATQDLQDPSSGTDWVWFGYSTGTKIQVLGKGEKGLDGVPEEAFDEAAISYVLLGAIENDGDYSVVKNVLISWVGPKVKPLTKARSSQHRVLLYNWANKITPMHAELHAHQRDQISNNLISQKLAGSKLIVEGDKAKAEAAVSRQRKQSSSRFGIKKGAQEGAAKAFDFVDTAASDEAIKAIRDENNSEDWVLFAHQAGKRDTLEIAGKGTGGVDAMAPLLLQDKIMYGLLNITFADDTSGAGYAVKKNIFIAWVGTDVKPLQKARSSQHRVALYNYADKLIQMHAEIQVLGEELTMDVINNKVKAQF